MRILRTLVLGLNTLLLTACSHNAGHAKPTAALVTKAPKVSGCFTAEEVARMNAIKQDARACRDEFNLCKGDELLCKTLMGVCSGNVQRKYGF